jgi:DNA-binding NarL/FixJ family response regulator
MPTDRVVRRTGTSLRRRDFQLAATAARATVFEILGKRRLPKLKPKKGPSDVAAIDPHAALVSLTPREKNVAELLATGKTNDEVGAHLGISGRTVEVHRHRIYKKFGVETARAFLQAASRAGLLPALARHGSLEDLTTRERQVAEAILRGETNEHVAEGLGISHRTVEVHRSNAFRKLGVSSSNELFRLMQP